jgi:hypothetical protein
LRERKAEAAPPFPATGRSDRGGHDAGGWIWLLAVVFLLRPSVVRAQDALGVVGGFAFAGRQDLTIERRSSPEGTVMSVTVEKDLPVDGGGTWGLTYTHWARKHPSFGLTIDALYWTSSLEMHGLDPARTPRTLQQQRFGLFPSFAGRIPLDADGGIFVFGAIGAGVVDSRLRGGDQRIGAGFSLATGLSFPLARGKLIGRVEARYLITHDFDSDDGNDQNFEFSGSRSWMTDRRLFGPHQDSRFFPVLFGVSWRF